MAAARPLFYIGAMSPYSWISAERMRKTMPAAQWRGVLLQAIFKAAGRTSWGLTEDRERGMAESEERARERGLGAIIWPDPWPTSDLLVARAMTYAETVGRLPEYALEAMRLEFREGAVLSEPEPLREAARRAGLDPGEMEAAIGRQEIKDALREVTDEAISAGVFGVPTVIAGGSLFWGDDRLAEAAAAAEA
ncbi:MAG TPA: DsbA family protein [Solirubrobacteraceae bacterium]|jgi:2-hydroxychromene-2-carboxylate isomerase|nr:DsbA family protein [Solirubrobacteraceae bacterium]